MKEDSTVLDEISVQISEENEHLPEEVKRLLGAMEYDIPYTSKALMEKSYQDGNSR